MSHYSDFPAASSKIWRIRLYGDFASSNLRCGSDNKYIHYHAFLCQIVKKRLQAFIHILLTLRFSFVSAVLCSSGWCLYALLSVNVSVTPGTSVLFWLPKISHPVSGCVCVLVPTIYWVPKYSILPAKWGHLVGQKPVWGSRLGLKVEVRFGFKLGSRSGLGSGG